MIKRIKFLVFTLFLGLFGFLGITFGNNVQRNLFFEIITKDQLVFQINNNFYYPDEQTNNGYKTIVTIPKISLQQSDTRQKMIFKILNKEKIYYVLVNLQFDSFEELNTKNKVYINVSNEQQQGNQDYIIQQDKGIYVQSSENITIKVEEKGDISANIVFPNILGVKKFWPIAGLGIIVMLLVFAYLVWKKQVIRI